MSILRSFIWTIQLSRILAGVALERVTTVRSQHLQEKKRSDLGVYRCLQQEEIQFEHRASQLARGRG